MAELSGMQVNARSSMVVSQLPFPPMPLCVLVGSDNSDGMCSSHDLITSAMATESYMPYIRRGYQPRRSAGRYRPYCPRFTRVICGRRYKLIMGYKRRRGGRSYGRRNFRNKVLRVIRSNAETKRLVQSGCHSFQLLRRGLLLCRSCCPNHKPTLLSSLSLSTVESVWQGCLLLNFPLLLVYI